MITFPNAKINLGLSITEKRPDGYHNLETVFFPIPLCDASLSKMRWKSGPAPKRTKSSPCISTEWRYPVIQKTI